MKRKAVLWQRTQPSVLGQGPALIGMNFYQKPWDYPRVGCPWRGGGLRGQILVGFNNRQSAEAKPTDKITNAETETTCRKRPITNPRITGCVMW
jgi:hypothetical protein